MLKRVNRFAFDCVNKHMRHSVIFIFASMVKNSLSHFPAGNAMTSSMPSLPASMSFDGFGLAAPAATPAMSQSQSGGMIGLGSMGGLDLSAMGVGMQTSSGTNPAQFPNPFGQPSMVPTNFAGMKLFFF